MLIRGQKDYALVIQMSLAAERQGSDEFEFGSTQAPSSLHSDLGVSSELVSHLKVLS